MNLCVHSLFYRTVFGPKNQVSGAKTRRGGPRQRCSVTRSQETRHVTSGSGDRELTLMERLQLITEGEQSVTA